MGEPQHRRFRDRFEQEGDPPPGDQVFALSLLGGARMTLVAISVVMAVLLAAVVGAAAYLEVQTAKLDRVTTCQNAGTRQLADALRERTRFTDAGHRAQLTLSAALEASQTPAAIVAAYHAYARAIQAEDTGLSRHPLPPAPECK